MGNITRAEMAVLIARILDLNGERSKLPFLDAAGIQGKWYEEAISQVYAAGMMSGDGNGAFRSEDLITRQELAVLIARVMDSTKTNWNTDVDMSVLDRFTDHAEIATWGTDGVAKIVKSGLFQGDNHQRFNPKATMTRAEAAAVLQRMLR